MFSQKVTWQNIETSTDDVYMGLGPEFLVQQQKRDIERVKAQLLSF